MTRKTAVVIGGASGIGKGISLALADDGIDVLVADIDAAAATALSLEIEQRGVRSRALACDVTDAAAVEALANAAWAWAGSVDLVFNNAGVITMGPALDFTTADLRWLFEVNVYGTWHGCHSFGRRFIQNGRPGWICNTASENAIGMSSVGSALYTGSKHAVLGITDVLRHEYAGKIGFSVLCPGAVNTGIWNSARHRQERFGTQAQPLELARRAMRYGLSPEEVGRMAVDGVSRGDFMILTHPHILQVAERRWLDVAEAIGRQWPTGAEPRHFSSAMIQSLVRDELSREQPEPPHSS